MTHAQPCMPPQATLSRSGEQTVASLRELEESHISGLVAEEDYVRQRAEKLGTFLRPMGGLWLAEILGGALIGPPLGTLIWLFTQQQYYTTAISVVGGMWGFTSLGRVLREKFAELRSRGRRKILIALLDNDLLTASEFAEYEDRLAIGPQYAA